MTDEVENILRGQVVVKDAESIKQIAVSEPNVKEDANGNAPLRKKVGQEALAQEPAAIAQPAPTQMNVAEQPATEELTKPLENPLEQKPVEAVNENAAPAPTVETPVETNAEPLENIDYNKPAVDGILTEAPVNVVSTGLDQIDVSGFVDKTIAGLDNLVKEEPVKEEVVQKTEMPVNNEAVQAVAPDKIDEALFEGAKIEAPQATETIPNIGDTPFTIPTLGSDNVEANQTPVENVNNEEDAKDEIPALDGLATMENSAPEMPAEEVKPVEEVKPAEEPVNINPTSAFDDHLKAPEEIVNSFTLPADDNNELNELPTIDTVQDELNKPSENIANDNINKKLDELLNKLDGLVAGANNFKNDFADVIKSMNASVQKASDGPTATVSDFIPQNLGSENSLDNTLVPNENIDNNFEINNTENNVLDNNPMENQTNNFEEPMNQMQQENMNQNVDQFNVEEEKIQSKFGFF